MLNHNKRRQQRTWKAACVTSLQPTTKHSTPKQRATKQHYAVTTPGPPLTGHGGIDTPPRVRRTAAGLFPGHTLRSKPTVMAITAARKKVKGHGDSHLNMHTQAQNKPSCPELPAWSSWAKRTQPASRLIGSLAQAAGTITQWHSWPESGEPGSEELPQACYQWNCITFHDRSANVSTSHHATTSAEPIPAASCNAKCVKQTRKTPPQAAPSSSNTSPLPRHVISRNSIISIILIGADHQY